MCQVRHPWSSSDRHSSEVLQTLTATKRQIVCFVRQTSKECKRNHRPICPRSSNESGQNKQRPASRVHQARWAVFGASQLTQAAINKRSSDYTAKHNLYSLLSPRTRFPPTYQTHQRCRNICNESRRKHNFETLTPPPCPQGRFPPGCTILHMHSFPFRLFLPGVRHKRLPPVSYVPA